MHLISGALRMTLIPLYQTEQQVLYVLGSSSLDLKPVEQRIAYFDDKLPPLFCVKSNELQHELSIQPFTFMYQSGAAATYSVRSCSCISRQEIAQIHTGITTTPTSRSSQACNRQYWLIQPKATTVDRLTVTAIFYNSPPSIQIG